MEDLRLWQLLKSERLENVDAMRNEVLPLLKDLADEDLSQRCVFFARVAPLLESELPEVRIAAINVLAGTTGWTAQQLLVDRLADDDEAVVEAAVKAIACSARDARALWAHGLFNRSAHVRSRTVEAIDDAAASDAVPMLLAMLSDPQYHTRIESIIDGVIYELPDLRLLKHQCDSGLVSRRLVKKVIANAELRSLAVQAEAYGYRPEEVERILSGGSAPQDKLDLLRWLFELFSDESDDISIAERFLAKLQKLPAIHADSDEFHRHFIASALVASRRSFAARESDATEAAEPQWNTSIANLCTFMDPIFLTLSEVPVSVRRETIAALYEQGSSCREQDEDLVKQILLSDICRRPSGQLDLWAIGGVLNLRRKGSYELLLEVHDERRIIAAFWEDPDASAAFFSNPGSPKVRTDLLEQIIAQRGKQKLLIYAILLHVVPASSQDFLDGLSREQSLDLFEHLLEIASPEMKLTVNRRRCACETLVARIGTEGLAAFLNLWLAAESPSKSPLALDMLADFARAASGAEFVAAVATLHDDRIVRLLEVIAICGAFPIGTELQLFDWLKNHEAPEIVEWRNSRAPAETKSAPEPAPTGACDPLEPALARRIAKCLPTDLVHNLKPCLVEPRRGVCQALASRTTTPIPNVQIASAILASHDSIHDIDRMFTRYGKEEGRFLSKLDVEFVERWRGNLVLPMIASAWLHCWEQHAFTFVTQTMQSEHCVVKCIETANTLNSDVLARQLWLAISRGLALSCARQREHAQELIGPEFCEAVASGLSEDRSCSVAAEIFVRMHHAKVGTVALRDIKPRVQAILPTLAEKERKILQPWIDSKGLGPQVAKRSEATGEKSELSAEIAGCVDLQKLESWCESKNANVVSDATLRLLDLDQAGESVLLSVLSRSQPVECISLIADSLPLWSDDLVECVHRILHDQECHPQTQFMVALNLIEQGDHQWTGVILGAACAPAESSWLQTSDLRRLLDAGIERPKLPLRLAGSPHPIAYVYAVQYILESPLLAGDPEAIDALRGFLLAPTTRPRTLRLDAAKWLHHHGEHIGYPLLLQHYINAEEDITPGFRFLDPEAFRETIDDALLAGHKLFDEGKATNLFDYASPLTDAYQESAARVMRDGTTQGARWAVARLLRPQETRSHKLKTVAETFAWGIPIGRELTGRMFTIEMIGDEDLGYTRLNENRVFISPLPIFRQVKHGREIVEALILHEYGHHVYHRGKEAEAVWRQAESEKLFHLLNLVSDEHLERNLRAANRSYGDRLKRLGAFAFQHQTKECGAEKLIAMFGGDALNVLIGARMRVARQSACVAVDSGHLLHELERTGSSFSRFFRALRMGLGNRHDDPKVAEALSLFDRKFRSLSMPDLMAIVYRLRDIFGEESQMLDCFNQDRLVCGGVTVGDQEGITNEEVQAEIRRITKPRKSKRGGGASGKSGGPRWINVSDDIHFGRITNIVRVPADRAQYNQGARLVQREAAQFRRYMDQLGIRHVPISRRLRGKRLDRSSLNRLVLHRDPRILIAREPQQVTDLFLGVVIDCSGSMEYDDNLEKAKLFGTMLAEAARGNRGIDLRLFGFTDDTIFDAGDANRPGVAALRVGGGNNDAAALYHAASVAAGSDRQAKLLVMISDGLPTECSADALRGLVNQLTRRQGICCAQVAVQPLSEVCFTNYIELNTSNPIQSVREFGAIVARLVRKAMAT